MALSALRRNRGQVVLEYVMMLVLTTLVALGLLALLSALSGQGERMIRLVSFNVP